MNFDKPYFTYEPFVQNALTVIRLSQESVLYDEDLNPLTYGIYEPKSGTILLPKGAKVMQFRTHKINYDYMEIAAFWDSKYRSGYVLRSSCVNYKDFNDNAMLTFMNDFEHLLYSRCKDHTFEGNAKKLYDYLEAKYEKLKNNPISDVQLENAYTKYKNRFRINRIILGDKFNRTRLGNQSQSILILYNAIVDAYPVSVNWKTIIPPISYDFFQIPEYPQLKDFYEKYVIHSPYISVQQAFMQFEVGDHTDISTGDHRPNSVNDLLDMFILLRKLVIQIGLSGSEAQWLRQTPFERLKDNLKTILMLGNETWKYTPDNPRANMESLGANDFLGPVRFHPFLTLLVHEINMRETPEYFLIINKNNKIDDTHNQDIAVRKKALYDYMIGNINLDDPDDPHQIDVLYQSSFKISLVNTKIFLNFL